MRLFPHAYRFRLLFSTTLSASCLVLILTCLCPLRLLLSSTPLFLVAPSVLSPLRRHHLPLLAVPPPPLHHESLKSLLRHGYVLQTYISQIAALIRVVCTFVIHCYRSCRVSREPCVLPPPRGCAAKRSEVGRRAMRSSKRLPFLPHLVSIR